MDPLWIAEFRKLDRKRVLAWVDDRHAFHSTRS